MRTPVKTSMTRGVLGLLVAVVLATCCSTADAAPTKPASRMAPYLTVDRAKAAINNADRDSYISGCARLGDHQVRCDTVMWLEFMSAECTENCVPALLSLSCPEFVSQKIGRIEIRTGHCAEGLLKPGHNQT